MRGKKTVRGVRGRKEDEGKCEVKGSTKEKGSKGKGKGGKKGR